MADSQLRVALDTNVLVYAEGFAPHAHDAHKPAAARDLIARLLGHRVLVPVQVLGEFYRVLVGKAGRAPAEIRAAVAAWCDSFAVLDTSAAAMLAAVDLAVDHELSIWDAVVLAAAAEGGCRLVLSEDMQHGFTWRGLTVVNPFATERHPLLAALDRS
ncbi:MAG TPA: PIN domain-containing protein [Geminicoccaceae bacterium]|nr:PIN domain-containing protein [Geminicoccaceae bacterium]